MSRKHSLHRPKRRRYARFRPHRRQRLYARALNFGFFFDFSTHALVATHNSLFVQHSHSTGSGLPFGMLVGERWTLNPRNLFTERHPQFFQQRQRPLITAALSADADIKAADMADLVAIDFYEHDLLFDAQRIIAPAVETFTR